MIASSVQKKNYVNPLEPTAWPTVLSQGPNIPEATPLSSIFFTLPETSVFPVSYKHRGGPSRPWEWVERLADRPTEPGANHLPFPIPYYLTGSSTHSRFCGF
jgi:hypothetical protein